MVVEPPKDDLGESAPQPWTREQQHESALAALLEWQEREFQLLMLERYDERGRGSAL
jgi:hypothetical protein